MTPLSPSPCFLTPDNSAIILLDYQSRVTIPVRSMDPQVLINNSVWLARIASALHVPTVLSTIHSRTSGELFPEILACFPGAGLIDRKSRNAWTNPAFLEAVQKTGRKKLVMAGLLTEVCLCFTALSALDAGYEVYVVVDASGGTSGVAHEAAVQRMIQAGAIPVSVQQVMAEYAEAVTSPELRATLIPIIKSHSGAFGQIFSYKEHLERQSR